MLNSVFGEEGRGVKYFYMVRINNLQKEERVGFKTFW